MASTRAASWEIPTCFVAYGLSTVALDFLFLHRCAKSPFHRTCIHNSTQFPDIMEISWSILEIQACGCIYLWKDVVLSKFTEADIFTSSGSYFFFIEGKNAADEYCISFKGTTKNAKGSLRSWSCKEWKHTLQLAGYTNALPLLNVESIVRQCIARCLLDLFANVLFQRRTSLGKETALQEFC